MMKKVIFILILILVGAGVFLWQWGRIASYQFVGQIEKVEGNMIYVKGLAVVPDKPESYNQDKIKSVVVLLDDKTILEKEVWYMLSAEELKKSEGRWDPNQLRKEMQQGSMGDLDAGASVTVESRENIYNKTEFRAKKVKYLKQVYPE